jgi:hypothetical protein
MGEQIEARAVEIGEPVPQRLVVGGNVIAPAFVPLGDRARRRLSFSSSVGRRRRRGGRWPRGSRSARVRRKVSLTSLCSSMVMATCGMLRDRVAQRQGAMRGQLDDEALGQRLDAVLLVVLRLRGWPPMVMTAR